MKSFKYIRNSSKSKPVAEVINQALFILDKLGVPFKGLTSRRLERMAAAFLAVADVRKSDDWIKTKGWDGTRALKTRDIIAYVNRYFEENISPGSYDNIRRRDLTLPVAAGIIQKSALNPNAARNDPTRAYALSPDYALIIQKFGCENWDAEVTRFLLERTTLADQLRSKREMENIPVLAPGGITLKFSPGKHNQLQKLIIEKFLPRFGFGAEILYVGDAASRFLLMEEKRLSSVGFFELSQGELPDVVAYSERKDWLFLIEAVHSSGPISPLRLGKLKLLLHECKSGLVFISAFLDRETFRKFAPEIAWETEVWIAEDRSRPGID